MSAEVELAVQARDRLIGDEEKGRAGLGDIGLLEPDRMARTVGIAMACDLPREDFDASARRRQGMCEGILAEVSDRAAVVCLLRHGQAAALPELLEAWRRQALPGEREIGRASCRERV